MWRNEPSMRLSVPISDYIRTMRSPAVLLSLAAFAVLMATPPMLAAQDNVEDPVSLASYAIQDDYTFAQAIVSVPVSLPVMQLEFRANCGITRRVHGPPPKVSKAQTVTTTTLYGSRCYTAATGGM